MQVLSVLALGFSAALVVAAGNGDTCHHPALAAKDIGNTVTQVAVPVVTTCVNKADETAGNGKGLINFIGKLYKKDVVPTITQTEVITATVTFTLAASEAPCETVTVYTPGSIIPYPSVTSVTSASSVPTVPTGTTCTAIPSTIMSTSISETQTQSIPTTLVTAPSQTTQTSTVISSPLLPTFSSSTSTTETTTTTGLTTTMAHTSTKSTSTTPTHTTTFPTETPIIIPPPTSTAGAGGVEVRGGILAALVAIMLVMAY